MTGIDITTMLYHNRMYRINTWEMAWKTYLRISSHIWKELSLHKSLLEYLAFNSNQYANFKIRCFHTFILTWECIRFFELFFWKGFLISSFWCWHDFWFEEYFSSKSQNGAGTCSRPEDVLRRCHDRDPLGCSSSYSPLATRGQQTLPQGNECLLLQPNSLLPRKELAIANREGQKWAFLRRAGHHQYWR